MSACVFCDLIAAEKYKATTPNEMAVWFTPLHPVTPGHVLVVPRKHVRDATENVVITAGTMAAAADLAGSVGPCNIITSVGAEATQSVFHLHVHIVPRREGDGLHLPWTGQIKEAS